MFDASKFTVDPVAFTIRLGEFTKPIYWYGVIIAAALLVGILLAMHNAKYRKFNSDVVLDLVLVTVPFAIIGARLYYVAFMWDQYFRGEVWYRTLLNIVAVWEGGLAIYGAVIGGLIGILIYSRWRKVSFTGLCDILAPSLILGQAIGRWGNFVNQEAYGYEISNPAFHFFPASVYIEARGAYFMATFFYESLWNLLVFIVLYLYLHRKKDARPGNVFLMYLALYGLGRVFIEPMRTDSLYIPGTNLRVSQVLSAILIVGSVAALIFRNMGDRKPASGDEVGASPDMDEIDPNLVLVRKEHRRNLTAETEGEAQPADGGSEQDAADAEDTGDAGDTGYAGDAGESPAQSEEPEQTGGETGEPADESQGETAQEAENGGEDKP